MEKLDDMILYMIGESENDGKGSKFYLVFFISVKIGRN